jgi:CheY-like chemotaxis protein
MVEVTVGNDGPLISRDDQPHLFDAFYTKGKRGGTGLGLAICKKVVTAHGGTILCRSSEATGTEFVLTLPLASGLQDQVSSALPASSEEVRTSFQVALQLDSVGKGNSDALRVQGVIEAARRLGRPLEVLIVDDEVLYGEGIRAMLTRVQELSGHVRTTMVKTAGAALEACKDVDFDLAICDLDLDDSARSGLALVERLRSRCPKLQICVHPNRSGVDEYRDAIHAGADAFLPKPMSRSHLVGLLQRGSMH